MVSPSKERAIGHQSNIVLRSWYVGMRDGLRLAVSVWLPANLDTPDPRPAVLVTTRYWRAMAFREDRPEYQDTYPLASHLWRSGYVLAVCDARGSGASFGTREIELPPDEIADIGEVVEWVAQQQWCNGRVATTGTSYTADTALMSLVARPAPLEVGVCRAVDFDVYRQVMAPGGIVNTWMARAWGEMTAVMDRNDAASLLADQSDEVKGNVIGVRPVDGDEGGDLLAAAIAEHHSNFNTGDAEGLLEFSDSALPGRPEIGVFSFSPHLHLDRIEASGKPLVYRAGWYDAGTALGALNLFATLSNPKRIIIGPWNHRGDHRADPFQPGDGTTPAPIPLSEEMGLTIASLDSFCKEDAAPLAMDVLEYYTLGENRWKQTRVWPLPGTRVERMYLAAGRRLSPDAPTDAAGRDRYLVDPTAGTGRCNRWHTQMGQPVHHPDRRQADGKLLVYETPPLDKDVEITGSPVLHLFVSSTAPDGQFFAYLEAVLPDGRVKCVTDGQLRAIHRRICDRQPPYTMFGPYHTFTQEDSMPLLPGEITEIAFDLLPISVRFDAGWRIRLAVAGADKDVFAPIPGCESPEITVERNRDYPSHIDLSVIPAEQQEGRVGRGPGVGGRRTPRIDRKD